MAQQYTLIIEPNEEEPHYTVSVPVLPGCVTQGRTREECIERAREAIAAWIADAIAAGEPIPEETERPQLVTIDVETVPSFT